MDLRNVVKYLVTTSRFNSTNPGVTLLSFVVIEWKSDHTLCKHSPPSQSSTSYLYFCGRVQTTTTDGRKDFLGFLRLWNVWSSVQNRGQRFWRLINSPYISYNWQSYNQNAIKNV